MSKRAMVPPVPFPTILADVFANKRGKMSQVTAREVLKLGFNEAQQTRADDLADRSREGTLTPVEKAELMEFARVANLLAMLQSEARMALKRAGKLKVKA
jgi:hypothetical protein